MTACHVSMCRAYVTTLLRLVSVAERISAAKSAGYAWLGLLPPQPIRCFWSREARKLVVLASRMPG